jgi:hypothetical protein
MKRSGPPSAVFFSGLAAILAGVGAYLADLCGAPGIAPILDQITGYLYGFFPVLMRLPEEG